MIDSESNQAKRKLPLETADAKGPGRIVGGDRDRIAAGYRALAKQPVDAVFETADANPVIRRKATTIGKAFEVSGPGTFFGKAQRTLRFEPTEREGWWFDRDDLPEMLPIGVSIYNVWTTARNIVLCSGSPHNYMRMVEHIVALRIGLQLDNVLIRLGSGDPPLFDRGCLDLVDAALKAGIVDQATPARWVGVKEPVTVGNERGGFLTLLPYREGDPPLQMDVAVDFSSAIGQQRLRLDVSHETFTRGAAARTNTTVSKMVYCKTIGQLFADTRNLGYSAKNILIAGRRRYWNEPKLLKNGKSLEAVWHRGVQDLAAALALIDGGRFAGRVISYKSGHSLDVAMVRKVYRHDLLCSVPVG